MDQINELKSEIATLEAETKQAAAAPEGEQPELIRDDDPELPPFVAPSKYDFVPKRTLREGKIALANRRRSDRLRSTVANESKPMSERIEAAKQIKAGLPSWSDLAQYTAEEVVERLTPHPHIEKLKELHKFICERAPIGDIDEYVKPRIAAIAEFRSLKSAYPKRNEGVPVLIDPEQEIAYQAAQHDPKHGRSRDTYRYVLGLFGSPVPSKLTTALQPVVAPQPEPEPVPETPTKTDLSDDLFWEYSQWRVGREASGLPTGIADFVAEREKASLDPSRTSKTEDAGR